MPNSETLRSFMSRVWEHGDLAAVDEVFVPDTVTNGLMPNLQTGPNDFKILVGLVQELITPPKITMIKTLESGNWVATMLSVEAEKADTLAPVLFSGMVFCRICEGKILEAYNNLDFISFFEQLGLLPDNTVALCLTGMEIS